MENIFNTSAIHSEGKPRLQIGIRDKYFILEKLENNIVYLKDASDNIFTLRADIMLDNGMTVSEAIDAAEQKTEDLRKDIVLGSTLYLPIKDDESGSVIIDDRTGKTLVADEASNAINSLTKTIYSGVLQGKSGKISVIPIDGYPTKGSPNLVSSNAVFLAINMINHKIDVLDDVPDVIDQINTHLVLIDFTLDEHNEKISSLRTDVNAHGERIETAEQNIDNMNEAVDLIDHDVRRLKSDEDNKRTSKNLIDNESKANLIDEESGKVIIADDLMNVLNNLTVTTFNGILQGKNGKVSVVPVDGLPTKNSYHLVYSGGVYLSIHTLSNRIDDAENRLDDHDNQFVANDERVSKIEKERYNKTVTREIIDNESGETITDDEGHIIVADEYDNVINSKTKTTLAGVLQAKDGNVGTIQVDGYPAKNSYHLIYSDAVYKAIKGLKNIIDTLPGGEETEEAITQLREGLVTLEGNLSAEAERIDGEISDLKSKDTTHDSQINTLTQNIETLQSSDSNQNTAISALTTTTGEHTTKIGNLENDYIQQESVLEKLSSSNKSLDEDNRNKRTSKEVVDNESGSVIIDDVSEKTLVADDLINAVNEKTTTNLKGFLLAENGKLSTVDVDAVPTKNSKHLLYSKDIYIMKNELIKDYTNKINLISIPLDDMRYRNTIVEHNNTYREKCLGNQITADVMNKIYAGDFSDIYVGDYWNLGGVKFRIAEINPIKYDRGYLTYSHSTIAYSSPEYISDLNKCIVNHVAIIPDINTAYISYSNDAGLVTWSQSSSTGRPINNSSISRTVADHSQLDYVYQSSSVVPILGFSNFANYLFDLINTYAESDSYTWYRVAEPYRSLHKLVDTPYVGANGFEIEEQAVKHDLIIPSHVMLFGRELQISNPIFNDIPNPLTDNSPIISPKGSVINHQLPLFRFRPDLNYMTDDGRASYEMHYLLSDVTFSGYESSNNKIMTAYMNCVSAEYLCGNPIRSTDISGNFAAFLRPIIILTAPYAVLDI